MTLKHELQSIISGNGIVRHGETIQAIANYIRRKKETISKPEKTKPFKNEEAEILKSFISANQLWIDFIPETSYIGEGAEQKIYEATDPQHIIKLNDTIFYESWLDYFHSLLLHNFFFPHLAYELIGFHYNEKLFAVVKQAYVKSTQATNLENVREFLAANGFI